MRIYEQEVNDRVIEKVISVPGKKTVMVTVDVSGKNISKNLKSKIIYDHTIFYGLSSIFRFLLDKNYPILVMVRQSLSQTMGQHLIYRSSLMLIWMLLVLKILSVK